jgi:hypothetical protein
MIENSVIGQHIHKADVLIHTTASIGKPLNLNAKKLRQVRGGTMPTPRQLSLFLNRRRMRMS